MTRIKAEQEKERFIRWNSGVCLLYHVINVNLLPEIKVTVQLFVILDVRVDVKH